MAKDQFYFYDLETTGLDPKLDRIMQFAGIRTNENFEQIGEPFECYVKLTEEVLPAPRAILTNGTSPQKTIEEGYTEAEFLRLVVPLICQPETIILGFNTIDFDDNFMRYTFYRNYYDPYDWQLSDGRSRWDLMNVVRMMRALRPEGINWPLSSEGKEVNRLEQLTAANGIPHDDAHDALGDVRVTIAIARLLREKQPKMFDYLLSIRSKQAVSKIINLANPQPLVYTSRFGTTIILPLGDDPLSPGGIMVYDLRVDPESLAGLDDTAFEQAAFHFSKDPFQLAAVVRFRLNACPMLAPLGVLDPAAEERIGLSVAEVQKRLAILRSSGLIERIKKTKQAKPIYETGDVEGQLYDSFIDNSQKPLMREVREASAERLATLTPSFMDKRLTTMFPRYKARNFPKSLSGSEREAWEEYRLARLERSLPQFSKDLGIEVARAGQDENKRFLLEELRLWAESLMPVVD